MSTKLLLLFLVLCATQLQTSVHGFGQKSRQTGYQTGLEANIGKPYSGVRGSVRHVDEISEYEKEKGVLIRNKRAAPLSSTVQPGPSTGSANIPPNIELIKKRVTGFVTVFGALTGTLIFLCLVNIGLFVWLSITLKKLKK